MGWGTSDGNLGVEKPGPLKGAALPTFVYGTGAVLFVLWN